MAESVGLPPAFEVYDVTAAGSVHALCPLKAKPELSIVVSAGATIVPPLSVTKLLVKETSFGRVHVLPAAGYKYIFCAVVSWGRVNDVESLLICTDPLPAEEMFVRPERFTCPPAVLLIWSQTPLYGMLIDCRPARLTWPLLLAEMRNCCPDLLPMTVCAERLRTVPAPWPKTCR